MTEVYLIIDNKDTIYGTATIDGIIDGFFSKEEAEEKVNELNSLVTRPPNTTYTWMEINIK